ncbi:MAG TPA: polysaccharide biosynthesis C-terminal domain-containing protein [Chitinophagaceae bacterium]|nr:polysaccharide biosynthesis C-terminal domain-containing protein [Chitinophagaceae bacterium]
MGIIKRQSLKTSIVNYVGVLIGVVFFNFVFPHLISEEYLGLIGLLQNLSLVLVSLPALGLSSLLLRYFSTWKQTSRLAQFNAVSLWLMSLALILFALLFFLFRQPIIDYYKTHSSLFIPYYYLVVPLVAILAFTQYFEMFSMVNLRVAVPAFIREILLRLLLIGLVYLFIYHWLSETQFVIGFVAVYFIAFAILALYAFFVLQFKASQPKLFLQDNPDLRAQIHYGGGMLLVVICSNVHNFLDGIILPAYLGLGALGMYIRPLVLGQMIQVPYRAITLISSPIIREAIVNNDLKKVKSMNQSIGLNLFLIGCFLFSLLVANADGIFSLLPASYIVAKNVLYIIATGRLLDMAFGMNSEIINYSKYYKYIITLSVVMMIMTISLNIWLIPMWGMNGAALSVSISLVVFNILKTSIIYAKFGFHCFSKHYLTLIAISVFTIAVLHFIPFITFVQHHMFFNACLNIIFKGGIGSLLFLVPTYGFAISSDLNHFIKLVLSGQLFKGGHRMENL